MNGPQIMFFGNLVRDPERKFTSNNGIPYSNIRVATNTYKGPDQQPETNFFDVTLWRRHAENAANHCRKGQTVFISGRYSVREYIRSDGAPGIAYQVTAKEFRYFPLNQLPPGEVQQAIANQPDTPDPTEEDMEYQLIHDDSDDLPF